MFICGLEETIFPISRATNVQSELEEERRLMYVAITRAEQRLFLTSSQSRYLFGERQFMVKSRFLGELASELGITPTRKEPQRETDYGRQNRYSGYGYDKNEDYGSSSYSNLSFSNNTAKRFTEAKPKPQVSAEKFSEYAIGKKVKHTKFGEGIIVGLKGTGANRIADVAFKGFGVKSLSIQFAPMELIKN